MSDISYQPQPILDDAADLFDKTKHHVPKYARPEASITASNDLKLVVAFLARYKSNPRTVAAYRSELERLLHWSWHVRKQSLLDHNDKDLVDYL